MRNCILIIRILNYGFESYHRERKTVKEIETHNTLIILMKIFTESPRFYMPGNVILNFLIYFNLNMPFIYTEKDSELLIFLA